MIETYKKHIQDYLSKAGLEIQQLEDLQENGFKDNSAYVEYVGNSIARKRLTGVIVSAPHNLNKILSALRPHKEIFLGDIKYDFGNGNSMQVSFIQCYARNDLIEAKSKIQNINL